MKVKKFLILLIATFFFSFLNVEAFSTSLGGKNEVNINENITININMSGLGGTGLASGQYYLNYDSSKLQYESYNVGQGKPGSDYNVSNDGNKVILLYIDNTATDNPLMNGIFASITFKAKAVGQASFSVSGSGFSTFDNGIVDLSSNSASKNVNIITPTTTTTTTTKKVNTTTTTTKATTTKPTTKPNENITTNKVENSTTKPTTTQPTTTKSNEEKLSNDNTLKKLVIKNYELNFDKDILEYSLSVPNEVDKLEVEYEVNNKKATVEIINKDLIIGENEVLIKVIAEDKSERIYKVKVNRNNKYILTDFNKINIINLINSDNKFIEVNIELNEKFKVIEKEILDLIKEKNVEFKFNINENNKIIYYVIINKNNIGYINDYLDLSILNKTNYNIEGLVYDINLKDNDTFNKKINIYFSNDKSLKKIYLYDKNDLELIKTLNISGDYIELNLDENSEYLLLSQEYKTSNNMLTILTVIFILLVIITITLIVMLKIKRGGKNEKKNSV